MLTFAATTATAAATADRLREIPTDFWLRLGAGVLIVVAAAIVLRKVAKMNKVVLSVVAALVFSTLGFSWIYERNEPTWASPAVGWLAGFFPTKCKVEAKRGDA